MLGALRPPQLATVRRRAHLRGPSADRWARRWVRGRAAAGALAVVASVAAGCGGGDAPVPRTDTVDLGDGASVSYIEVTPDAASSSGGSPSADAGAGDPAPVVFLHGAAYDAAVWQRLGLLDDVAGLGRRAIALDLPDRGGSEGDVDEEWLSAALDALGIDRAIIVAPSMSGQMALPLLAMHADRFAGFVPVAPVGGGEFTWPGGEAPPTAVVLGAEDDSFADSTRALAAEIPDATLVVVDDAGHAAYEDDPAAFLDALEGVLGR